MITRLIQFMLNIHPSSWTQGGQWRMEWLSMPKHDLALLLAACIGLVAWTVMIVYRREGNALHFLSRWSLIGLRLLALSGILVMLLEPVLVFSKTDYVPSNLIVLSDASGSMDLQDAYTDPQQVSAITSSLKIKETQLQQQTRRQLIARALNQNLLKQLASNGDRIVHQHDFAARLLPPTSRPTTDTSGTAIGVAIRQAIAAYQGQPIAGILLVSDGQNNTGETPVKAAEFAAAAGVPIVSLAVGTSQGPRSAKITKLDVSPIVFVRDSSPLHVLIESHGMSHLPASVVLERSRNGGPWEEIGRQFIVLGETGQMQTVNFDFKEDRPAKLQMRARLEDAGTELKTDDHTAIADVRAINQKMKVLFIAGENFPRGGIHPRDAAARQGHERLHLEPNRRCGLRTTRRSRTSPFAPKRLRN